MLEYFIVCGLLVLIGVGLPVPEESVLLIAAFLAATGSSALIMLLVCVLGIACSDTMLYLKGRLQARRFRSFKPGKQFIASAGFFAMFTGRFFISSRMVLPFMAGAMQMKRGAFHAASLLSGFCLTSIMLLLGRWLYTFLATAFPLAVAAIWLFVVLLVTGVLMMYATRSQVQLVRQH